MRRYRIGLNCVLRVLLSIALLVVSFTSLERLYAQTNPASAILGRAGWEALRQWAAGMFDGKIRVPVRGALVFGRCPEPL